MKPMQSLEFPLTSAGCAAVREILDAAERNADFAVAVTVHCERCATCQQHNQQLTNLRNLLAGSNQPRVPVPANFDLKLRQRIAASKEPMATPWWVWIRQPALGVTAAAAVLIAVLVGVDYIQKPTHNSNQITASNIATAPLTSAKSESPEKSTTSTSHVAATSSPAPVSDNAIADNSAKSIENSDGVGLAAAKPQISRPMAGGGRQLPPVERFDRRESSVPVSMVVYGARPVIDVVNSDDMEVDSSTASRDESTIF